MGAKERGGRRDWERGERAPDKLNQGQEKGEQETTHTKHTHMRTHRYTHNSSRRSTALIVMPQGQAQSQLGWGRGVLTSSKNGVTRRVPPSHTKFGGMFQCFSMAVAAARYMGQNGSWDHDLAFVTFWQENENMGVFGGGAGNRQPSALWTRKGCQQVLSSACTTISSLLYPSPSPRKPNTRMHTLVSLR